MGSTISEIKRIKQMLQKLRADLIKAGDVQEADMLRRRIVHHEKTLAMLEG